MKLNTFTSLTLNQSMYDHHTFELVVGHDIIEDLGSHVLDRSRSWIGKDFTLLFGDNVFMGIVTAISMDHQAGLNGDLVISGASPTILLDAGEHRQSWNERHLKWIVEEVAETVGLKTAVAPAFKGFIDYMAQYGESHFDFLKRLAVTYHEWMYYDGRKLVFGKPSGGGAPLQVVYGTDLDHVQVTMRALPVRRKAYSYQSGRDETIQSEASGHIAGLDSLGAEALSASTDRFALVPQGPMPTRVTDKQGLDKALQQQYAADAARLSALSGSGTAMALRPGVVADISAAVRLGKAWELKKYGKYVVTDIRHHFTGIDHYHNSFTAVPAGLDVLPAPRIQMPHAEPELATVVSSEDPDNQGRVQVRFFWQDKSMTSSWLRVMTNDAGKSDKVGTNRGMVTIPEEGDQVMVGYRYGDPMRPFVMGSLFHGASGGGGGQGNKTKSITTRSGNTVTFDDDSGSITIKDSRDGSVSMDGKGNIAIGSGTSITLSTGKSSITLLSDGTIAIEGKNILVTGSESTVMMTGGSSFSTDPKEATVSARTVNVSGSKEVSVNGGMKTSISSTGKVALSGAKVTLN
ncbi:MAG: hypothetical protein RLZZ165_689 [Bacteroidota bacterium]|jgi:uncharacterized protein involved in type VI secretion and phage assembly